MLNTNNPDRKPKKQTKQKSRSTKKASRAAKKVSSKRKQLLKDLMVSVDEADGLKRTITSLQEQVGSYVLLGYSFNGAPITAVAASTPQEYDALYQRVQTFLQQRPPAILYQPLDSPPPEE